MYLKNSSSKVVGYRRFLLLKYLKDYCNTIFTKGARMKPPKEIRHVLVEWKSLIKRPGQMKGCVVIIYIQVQIQIVNKKKFSFQMEIIFETNSNEHMHERVLCSQVILITHWIN